MAFCGGLGVRVGAPCCADGGIKDALSFLFSCVALPKNNRLTDKARISHVLRFGKRFFVPGIRMSVMRAGNSQSRVVVIVPKASDKRAVVRNKLRRRTLEAMSPLFLRPPIPLDVVITVGKDAVSWNFDDFKAHLRPLFKKITHPI